MVNLLIKCRVCSEEKEKWCYSDSALEVRNYICKQCKAKEAMGFYWKKKAVEFYSSFPQWIALGESSAKIEKSEYPYNCRRFGVVNHGSSGALPQVFGAADRMRQGH